MEKKKILIIGMSMNVGGAEKSLVNFLNLINYDQYAVDLLLFQNKGKFMKQIPERVNKVKVKEISALFQPFLQTVKMDGMLKYIVLAVKRYAYTLIERLKWKQFDRVRIRRWVDYYAKLIPKNQKQYDIGIAYAGGETAYYLMDKVQCARKVYFFHSDYSKIDIDTMLEKQYVEKADLIVTISKTCRQSLLKLFPACEDRITVLQNLSSPELIKKLSQEFYPSEYDQNRKCLKLVSIGRLHEIKGYDMVIEAAAILKEKNIAIQWYIVGEGAERDNLTRKIKHYHLQEQVHLIGLRENPYPYIVNADILVQSSRFEGKSVVLDEAKILAKPIIVTHYNSSEDQIADGTDGIIVPISAGGLADGIEQLLHNPDQREKMHQYLMNNNNADICNIELYMSTICGENL